MKAAAQVLEAPAVVAATFVGAAAAGLLDREGVIGRIHGVSTRAANIRVGAAHLLTLARSDVPPGPIVVVIQISPPTAMPQLDIRFGAHVEKSDRFLTIHGSRLSIDLGSAQVWRGTLMGPATASLARAQIIANWCAARTITLEQGARGSLLELADGLGSSSDPMCHSVFAAAALSPARRLLHAVRYRDLETVSGAATGLVGLGPGLTPSGDDLLAGFMSSLIAVAAALGADVEYARAVNSTILTTCRGRTTLLSEVLLAHASRAEVSETAHRVIAEVISGDERRVREATRALLAVGHYSGTDTMLGILMGCSVFLQVPWVLGTGDGDSA